MEQKNESHQTSSDHCPKAKQEIELEDSVIE